MYTMIQGIPVEADPSLSLQEIEKMAGDIIQSWKWEGRKLGRIEISCAKQGVRVCSYEQPFTQLIPVK